MFRTKNILWTNSASTWKSRISTCFHLIQQLSWCKISLFPGSLDGALPLVPRYPYAATRNIWPKEVPGLEEAFKATGKLATRREDGMGTIGGFDQGKKMKMASFRSRFHGETIWNYGKSWKIQDFFGWHSNPLMKIMSRNERNQESTGTSKIWRSFFSTFEFQQIGYRYRKLKTWDTNGFAKWVIFGSFIIHSQGIFFWATNKKCGTIEGHYIFCPLRPKIGEEHEYASPISSTISCAEMIQQNGSLRWFSREQTWSTLFEHS